MMMGVVPSKSKTYINNPSISTRLVELNIHILIN